ncbi:hypothetical protein [Rhizobium sp. BR 362]|uniref:hypothetical protein n=1 Tax=Rhizobium sp. BR 362 TaxID=3040670 RepID=UPI003FA69730
MAYLPILQCVAGHPPALAIGVMLNPDRPRSQRSTISRASRSDKCLLIAECPTPSVYSAADRPPHSTTDIQKQNIPPIHDVDIRFLRIFNIHSHLRAVSDAADLPADFFLKENLATPSAAILPTCPSP